MDQTTNLKRLVVVTVLVNGFVATLVLLALFAYSGGLRFSAPVHLLDRSSEVFAAADSASTAGLPTSGQVSQSNVNRYDESAAGAVSGVPITLTITFSETDVTALLPLVIGPVGEAPIPPAPPAGFARWRSADGGFDDWERDGVRLAADGRLQLELSAAPTESDPYPSDGYYGHNFYNGGTFKVGVARSPVMTSPLSFSEAVASWNADTPGGSWIETLVRVQLGDRWTGWYNLGVWAAETSAVERHSVKAQSDADGYVAVDTLVLTNAAQPVSAYQLKLRLFSENGITVPSVRNMSFAFSETLPAGTLPPGNPDDWGRVLSVPECSQMVYPDGGIVWCSPTSTTMVLKYWTQDSGPCEPDVRAAVAGVYDWLYDGHGNWPFNTAYAATHKLDAYVARLTSLAQAEQWIAADVPVVFSLAWGSGELTGAPFPWSDGHLMVLVGFDAEGNPVLNDPGAPNDNMVQRTYSRAQFEKLWLEHTNGTVYLVHPSDWSVPDL